MERSTEHDSRAIVGLDGTAADVARAIHSLTDADLVRLRALARLWTRGLPGGLAWSDILHEAIARALDGSRKCRPACRSSPSCPGSCAASASTSGGASSRVPADRARRRRRRLCAAHDARDPERMLAAAQRLAAIHRLIAGDAPALKIIAGLAEGLMPDEICRRYALSEREYDTTRKRMRRALLRRGLAWRDA